MQLPCIIGSCSNRSVNLAGGAHLGDLATGTNKHYRHREKSWVFKNTFLIQISVWLKSDKRAENWRKPELCAGSSSQLSWSEACWPKCSPSLLTPSRPPPCPYGIKQRTEDNNRIQKEKKCKEADRNLKREKKNQSQQSKRTVGRTFPFQNLKAPS